MRCGAASEGSEGECAGGERDSDGEAVRVQEARRLPRRCARCGTAGVALQPRRECRVEVEVGTRCESGRGRSSRSSAESDQW